MTKNIIILPGKILKSNIKCRDCKYYIPFESNEKLSKCLKFSEPYSSNNIKSLMFADIMRKTDIYCGPSAKYFGVRSDL